MTPSSSASTSDLSTNEARRSKTSASSMSSPTADRNRAFECETVHEHAEPSSESTVAVVEQIVAPVERGAKGLMARQEVVRTPPVSRRNRSSSRSRSCRGLSIVVRAAASSIANGMPSRRRQISPTAAALSSVSTKRSSMAAARSAKSAIAGYLPASAPARFVTASGVGSEGIRNVASPEMPRL